MIHQTNGDDVSRHESTNYTIAMSAIPPGPWILGHPPRNLGDPGPPCSAGARADPGLAGSRRAGPTGAPRLGPSLESVRCLSSRWASPLLARARRLHPVRRSHRPAEAPIVAAPLIIVEQTWPIDLRLRPRLRLGLLCRSIVRPCGSLSRSGGPRAAAERRLASRISTLPGLRRHHSGAGAEPES